MWPLRFGFCPPSLVPPRVTRWCQRKCLRTGPVRYRLLILLERVCANLSSPQIASVSAVSKLGLAASQAQSQVSDCFWLLWLAGGGGKWRARRPSVGVRVRRTERVTFLIAGLLRRMTGIAGRVPTQPKYWPVAGCYRGYAECAQGGRWDGTLWCAESGSRRSMPAGGGTWEGILGTVGARPREEGKGRGRKAGKQASNQDREVASGGGRGCCLWSSHGVWRR